METKIIRIYPEDYEHLKMIAKGFEQPKDIVHKVLNFTRETQPNFNEWLEEQKK